jgi:DNA primase
MEDPESVQPLGIDSNDDDQAILAGVLEHYRARRAASLAAREALGALGVSGQLADAYAIGLSDRSLGLRLPKRRSGAGDAIRDRLCSLGLYRASGHEHLVGCLVVPVRDHDGAIVALVGLRLERPAEQLYAEGLPGGVFNEGCLASGTGPVLVASSIADVLVAIGAGFDALGPARAGGFDTGDLRRIAASGRELVVACGDERLAHRLAEAGAAVGVIETTLCLAELVSGTASASSAVGALIESASRLGEDRAGNQAAAAPASGSGERSPGEAAPLVEFDAEAGLVNVAFASRHWRVRGVGAGRGADSLKVALQVSDAATGRFHLDGCDLYSARARHGFLEAAAGELRVGVGELAPELNEVIAAVESAREELARPVAGRAEMTAAEREEALGLLRTPELLSRVVADLGSLGVVGEETTLSCCYLAAISRLCERPFGAVVASASSSGKSSVLEAVCSLVPEEDLVNLSAITAQALYYLAAGALCHKVLVLAEEHGASRAGYALKLLLSEGRLSIAATGKERASGRLSTRSYEVAGPVSVLMTATDAELDPELENRLVTLSTDESAATTAAIQAAQMSAMTLDALVARRRREQLVRLHRNAQRLLQSFPIVLPPGVALGLPSSALRHRRDHQKALSMIAAITILHQHQREQRTAGAGEAAVSYLEASATDVERGIELARSVLFSRAAELAPAEARLCEAITEHARTVAEQSGCELYEVGVTRRELRGLLGWSDKQVRSATDRLVRLEHLVSTPGGRGRLRRYRLVESFEASGPERPSRVQVAGTTSSSPSVRPPAGRTSQAPRGGRSSQFAHLAASSRAHDACEDDVDEDVDADGSGQMSFAMPGAGGTMTRRRGRR